MALLRFLCVPSSLTTHQNNPISCSSPSSSCSPVSLSTTSPFSSSSLSFKTRKAFVFRIACYAAAADVEAVVAESSVADVVETLREAEIREEEEEASRSRLCVQNVPWSATADDVRKLLDKYGTVVNLELSMHNKTRNRGLAFVTMGSPEEALAALTGLQLTEFEGRTLNVNYANPQKKKSSDKPKTASLFNLFVANLSYETRSKDLRKLFEDGGFTVYTAEVIFHENTRQASGYGFVSFNTKEDADAALTSFQGKTLLGRQIRLARSKRYERHETKTSPPVNVPIESEPQAVIVDAPTESEPQQTANVDVPAESNPVQTANADVTAESNPVQTENAEAN